jgi:hypothetical protein
MITQQHYALAMAAVSLALSVLGTALLVGVKRG